MTLYNLIVFCMLVLQMVCTLALVIPLPNKVRGSLLRFIATSELVAKLQYGLKILFIFVAVLFVDATQHMIRTQKQHEAARASGYRHEYGRSESEIRSRMFLSQRNFYLTGFTLFLSLILSRSYSTVSALVRAEDRIATLEKSGAGGDAGLKKQIQDLQAEYNALSDKYSKATGTPKTNKKAD